MRIELDDERRFFLVGRMLGERSLDLHRITGRDADTRLGCLAVLANDAHDVLTWSHSHRSGKRRRAARFATDEDREAWLTVDDDDAANLLLELCDLLLD